MIIEVIKAIVLGIIEGVTEWLPVSSTSHMMLVNEFLNLQASEEFVDTFMVVVQLGAILAVGIFFFKKLWPFDFIKNTKEGRDKIWSLWFRVLVGCIPAGVIGVLFDDLIDSIFFNPLTIGIMLIVYGIGFIIVESLKIKETMMEVEDIDYLTSANIGLFQLCALIPGTSRSGATILGARLLGCSKTAATEFTFFMAIPVMAGASLLKLLKCGFAFTTNEWIILAAGCISAFVVSIICIKMLINYIKTHSFKPFGIYRIVLGIVVLVYFYVIK